MGEQADEEGEESRPQSDTLAESSPPSSSTAPLEACTREPTVFVSSLSSEGSLSFLSLDVLRDLFGESEDFPEGTGYIPEWGSSSSCVVHTVNDDSEVWMKDMMKSKRYECCFQYVSWDLLTCMSDASR